jgi:hypothetical protein
MASHKALTGKHRFVEFDTEAIVRRVKKMMDYRDAIDVKNAHVKLSYDNRKTTALVPSVSLIPVADCHNCSACFRGCYDVRNVCYLPSVQKSRANNSAILHEDMERYFHEILEAVKFLRFFRWHVGGDMTSFWYWEHVVDIARRTPRCEFLIFTKMFDIVNHWLDKGNELPSNLHVIFSDWVGSDFKNPYDLPISSPVWSDGKRGPHAYTDKAIWCPGDCSACAEINGGCWGAKNGDTILFEAH